MQEELFQQWKKAGQGKFPDAPNLKTVLRPKIDKVSRELLMQWGRAQPLLARPEVRQVIRARSAEIMSSITDKARMRAVSPLLE